jgi:hypothetical protein
MGGDPGIEGTSYEEGAPMVYYAIDPRGVGGVVEKSWENRPCDAKCGKYEVSLGERLEEAVRDVLSV